MSFLFGSNATNSDTGNRIQSLRVQNSAYGLPRALVFGRNRVAGNLLWYGDFAAVAHQQSAGKGMGASGGKAGGMVTYTYSASLVMAICEGPINGIYRVWKNKSTQSFEDSGFALKVGGLDQSPWAYLTAQHPQHALGYSGLANVAAWNYQLGESAQLPLFNFEVDGFFGRTGLGSFDADPKDVVKFLLTDSRLGAMFPSDHVDSLTEYSNYCLAADLLISPVYSEQRSAAEIIEEIVELTNSAVFYSEDKLKIVHFGDTALAANGATYTPPEQPLFDLGDDDFLDKDSPVRLTRKRPADLYNSVSLEFFNRANRYNLETIVVKNSASVEQYGLRPMDVRQGHIFADKATARRAAQLLLQRQLVANEYTFRLGWRWIVLEQMDLVTITDSGLGLDRQWVRIRDIEEDEEGALTITAEEYLVGTGASAEYEFDNPDGFFHDYEAACGNANPPAFCEAPGQIAQDLEIWGAVSGGDGWGGCDVYVSTDDQSYRLVGSIQGNARHGVLTAALPIGAGVDDANTLSVDLSISRGQLQSGTAQDAQLLHTLIWVDGAEGGEWMAYQTATLTDLYKYDLTHMVRGVYGSKISAHPAGSKFVRMDDRVFQYQYDQALIGKPIYTKFLGKNIYGAAVQDISELPAYVYRPTGRALLSPPRDPANLVYGYYAGQARLTWDAVQDFRAIDYEVRLGDAWATAKFMARTPHAHFPYWGDGRYWVAARYKALNGLAVYSEAPASLVITDGLLRDNVIATHDESLAWDGTLVNLDAVAGNLRLDGAVSDSGSYTIPAAHRIDAGRVAPCSVLITYAVYGQSKYADILSTPDILSVADILGSVFGGLVDAIPQIRTAGEDGVFGDWQNYVPGVYVARHYDARLLVYCYDQSVYAVCTGLTFSVDVPDLVQSGTVALPASAEPVSFATPYIEVPNIQITIIGASAGDDVILTSPDTSGFTVGVKNGASFVARTINWQARGY